MMSVGLRVLCALINITRVIVPRVCVQMLYISKW